MIHTITLPVPWDLKSVNVHLVELDEGYLLVDSGVGTEKCFLALEAALAELGAKWTDIRTLLLTHCHPDHIGLSWKILERSGARLLMHRADAAFLEELTCEDRVSFFEEAMRIGGVPEGLSREIAAALREHRPPFRAHRPDWTLEGGETIPIRGGTLKTIWTTGHTPGHVCLYSPETRTLISGDHVLEKITPNIAWHPDRDMLAEFLASLELLSPYEIDSVLPSHGPRFEDHRRVIAGIVEHHRERCSAILENTACVAMTAHELVLALWRRKLAPFHHSFATFEILAHLEYMSRRGQISSETRHGGALAWKSA